MPFVDDIRRCQSVAIVGMEKNTGKTETLNYIIARLKEYEHHLALTSIGIDGERRDQVTQTDKPEITLHEGVHFLTSEQHYLQKRLLASIVDVSEEETALGKLVTARALEQGKVLLSGPSTTEGLRRFLARMPQHGVQTTLVDGALSRLSLASPLVSEAMVLATGAALSINVDELVRRTKSVYQLISLRQPSEDLIEKLSGIEQGLWAIDADGHLHDLGIRSALMIKPSNRHLLSEHGQTLYAAGAVNDKMLEYIRLTGQQMKLIICDFTRVFAEPKSIDLFLQSGMQLESLYASSLLAVTINPLAPTGYRIESQLLRSKLEAALGIPVYNVRDLASH